MEYVQCFGPGFVTQLNMTKKVYDMNPVVLLMVVLTEMHYSLGWLFVEKYVYGGMPNINSWPFPVAPFILNNLGTYGCYLVYLITLPLIQYLHYPTTFSYIPPDFTNLHQCQYSKTVFAWVSLVHCGMGVVYW